MQKEANKSLCSQIVGVTAELRMSYNTLTSLDKRYDSKKGWDKGDQEFIFSPRVLFGGVKEIARLWYYIEHDYESKYTPKRLDLYVSLANMQALNLFYLSRLLGRKGGSEDRKEAVLDSISNIEITRKRNMQKMSKYLLLHIAYANSRAA